MHMDDIRNFFNLRQKLWKYALGVSCSPCEHRFPSKFFFIRWIFGIFGFKDIWGFEDLGSRRLLLLLFGLTWNDELLKNITNHNREMSPCVLFWTCELYWVGNSTNEDDVCTWWIFIHVLISRYTFTSHYHTYVNFQKCVIQDLFFSPYLVRRWLDRWNTRHNAGNKVNS